MKDNGKGFDPAKAGSNSFGLIGMRERALMLGGDLEICSKEGNGTELKVCIPLLHKVQSSITTPPPKR